MLGDMLLIIFVTFWTILLMYVPYILGLKQNIIDDWASYRCNPIVLPIAGWINKENDQSASEATSQNFQYCTQNIMGSFMGYLLEPLNFITSGLANMGGEVIDSLNYVRAVISNVRDFFMNIVQSLMSIFTNIIIEFVKIFIGIRDLAGKMVGVVLTIVYVLEGLSLSGESLMNGWVGDIFNVVCFHPDTIIQKIDGTKCKMSELSLGDKIDGNSEVQIIMKIKNTPRVKFYKFVNGEENIYVTGSHLIYLNEKDGYIPVAEHSDAESTEDISDELCCLVTDNHNIKIGKYVFHDWEDDKAREKYEYNKMII